MHQDFASSLLIINCLRYELNAPEMANFTPSTNLIVILSCISSQHGVLVDDG